MPQGSARGPVKFVAYTESVTPVFGRHCIDHHLFTDDKQAYASTTIEDVDDVHGSLQDWYMTSATGALPVDFNSTRTRRSSLGLESTLV